MAAATTQTMQGALGRDLARCVAFATGHAPATWLSLEPRAMAEKISAAAPLSEYPTEAEEQRDVVELEAILNSYFWNATTVRWDTALLLPKEDSVAEATAASSDVGLDAVVHGSLAEAEGQDSAREEDKHGARAMYGGSPTKQSSATRPSTAPAGGKRGVASDDSEDVANWISGRPATAQERTPGSSGEPDAWGSTRVFDAPNIPSLRLESMQAGSKSNSRKRPRSAIKRPKSAAARRPGSAPAGARRADPTTIGIASTPAKRTGGFPRQTPSTNAVQESVMTKELPKQRAYSSAQRRSSSPARRVSSTPQRREVAVASLRQSPSRARPRTAPARKSHSGRMAKRKAANARSKRQTEFSWPQLPSFLATTAGEIGSTSGSQIPSGQTPAAAVASRLVSATVPYSHPKITDRRRKAKFSLAHAAKTFDKLLLVCNKSLATAEARQKLTTRSGSTKALRTAANGVEYRRQMRGFIAASKISNYEKDYEQKILDELAKSETRLVDTEVSQLRNRMERLHALREAFESPTVRLLKRITKGLEAKAQLAYEEYVDLLQHFEDSASLLQGRLAALDKVGVDAMYDMVVVAAENESLGLTIDIVTAPSSGGPASPISPPGKSKPVIKSPQRVPGMPDSVVPMSPEPRRRHSRKSKPASATARPSKRNTAAASGATRSQSSIVDVNASVLSSGKQLRNLAGESIRSILAHERERRLRRPKSGSVRRRHGRLVVKRSPAAPARTRGRC